ncbi:hypothetical protein JW721_02935 [Candidatus Micrarchaeota archaeon]|nr:hypothetical protein [Candidatus Micrarchaeota archaeon]
MDENKPRTGFGLAMDFMSDFYSMLGTPQSAKDIYELYASRPYLYRKCMVDTLSRKCQDANKAVRTNASSALIRIMEKHPFGLTTDMLNAVLDSVNAWWHKEARAVRSKAKQMLLTSPQTSQARAGAPREIEKRREKLARLERASRAQNPKSRSRASAKLIKCSRGQLPEVRMCLLKGLILRNALEKECLHIARQAAEELVNFCLEKKDNQPEGERSRRILEALRFFESLPYSLHLFGTYINELEAKRVSQVPLAAFNAPMPRRAPMLRNSSISQPCSRNGSQNPGALSSRPKRISRF